MSSKTEYKVFLFLILLYKHNTYMIYHTLSSKSSLQRTMASLLLPRGVNSITMSVIALYFFLLHTWADGSLFERDRITALPGQPHVTFNQYSGYVTVDKRKQRSLFYYFVEARSNPDSSPLVLWLNGGPGCSSLGVGAFIENGPFRPSGHTLVENEHSWNKVANMLYLETPIGVGFSYSLDRSAYSYVDDNITARDNLSFMKNWFAKFPHYKKNSLFIAGESYAGHYIPQLVRLMLKSNKRKMFNLKGVALGNPVLEFATDLNSRGDYLWAHGVISDSTHKMFTSFCNYSRYVSEYYRESLSHVCSKVMKEVSTETSRFVDVYDVTLDVCLPSLMSQSIALTPERDAGGGGGVDVCVEDETFRYLQRSDVHKALHARLIGVSTWSICSRILNYEVLDLEVATIGIVGEIVLAGIQVIVYSGDQDSVIPLMGSRRVVGKLARDLGLNTTVPYSVWFQGKQVGGWTQSYGNVLTFATIRGASHEAPFSQPKRSLVLFEAFLAGKPLPASF